MKMKTCNGYEELGSPDTNCSNTLIAVIGVGGEYYCSEHENMAGSVIRRFNPPVELPDNYDD